jgi:beta-aspartyl-peptidase (threonine type)
MHHIPPLWRLLNQAFVVVSSGLLIGGCSSPLSRPGNSAAFCLAVHGGAGVLSRSEMTPEKEAAYRGALENALQTGRAVLATNGTASMLFRWLSA